LKSSKKLFSQFLRILLILSFLLLSSCDSSSTDEESSATDDSGNSSGAVSTSAVNSSEQGGAEWTVLMYQDADDDVLEEDTMNDLNEAELAGSTDEVNIVSQFDRYDGAYDGDGNWTTTKRFYVTKDDDLTTINSEEIEDMGELNMSDEKTLEDFITWGIQNYPAKKYALILADHGMGWPGGWTDYDPDPDDQLYMTEITEALSNSIKNTGIDKFEFVGFDACLMGQIEVFSAIAPYANYSVASEETEPAMGWAYGSFLTDLVNDPSMSGRQMAGNIVDSYIVSDQMIVSDDERAYLMGNEKATEQQAAKEYSADVTLSAVDLSAIPDVLDSLNSFSDKIADASQDEIAQARTYSQSYESVFGDEEPKSYIDLGNFASLAGEMTGSEDIVVAATKLQSSISNALIREKHGDERSGSTGITIYFPVSDLYTSTDLSGVDSYVKEASNFAEESHWDDFLSYHYGLSAYEPAEGSVAQPENVEAAVAPGAEELTVDPIQVTADTVSASAPITFSSTVHGSKIGFIYTFIGYYDADSNSVLISDEDYFFADNTKEYSGIYYPDWGDTDSVDVEFEWDGSLFAINDGKNSEFALIEPSDYGAQDESPTYSVDGIYTYSDGSTVSATMYFTDGQENGIYGYTGNDGTGGMSEIIPQNGDQFTILQKWISLDSGDISTKEGGTLTFGDYYFTWESTPGQTGEYVVGFVAEDLDGNQYSAYSQVTLE
jgi:hypothetical protein